MGEKFTIRIESVMGGIAPSLGFAAEDQFSSSIGLDPDLPSVGTAIRPSGVLVPAAYSDFSSAGLSGVPLWIVTNPKNTLVYVYASDGEFISYNSTLVTETVIGTPTSGEGNGAWYYNNYIYLTTPTNMSRYGPLDGTPTISNAFWGTTLGLTLFDNTITYPTNRGVKIPNHAGHVHTNGKAYICDFDAASATDTNRGKGLIHTLSTKYGTSGTAHQGAVNDGSAYNSLDLPYDYAPIDIESYGTSLVIAAMNTTDTVLSQGKAALFFWDTIADSFYAVVPLLDPIVTALLNHNGNLLVWSGNMNDGVRVSRYAGGYSFEQVAFFEEGMPPLAGAVDGLGNRVVWGAATTYPENAACVYSIGYKNSALNPLALHNIIRATASATATAGMVSSLKYVQQASFITPRLAVGWRDATDFGIDKLGSTFGVAVFRSKTYNIGRPFQVKKVTIPLATAVAADMTIIPTIYVDDESGSTALTTINNTNFAGSERVVHLYPNNLFGQNNFLLQLRWSGTSRLAVNLPIVVEAETLENAS